MSGVIERLGHTVDANGYIVHNDQPVTWEYAERLFGPRLDRRKKYAIIDNQLCTSVSWTGPCSGCANGIEERGSGCDECGHHGKSRQSYWVPERYSQ